MVNMLRNYRNNASVVMWSIGNEVPTQCSADGYRVASFLQEICHREDPTRPVTCGMDQVTCVLGNGFAALLDVPGFNYRVHRYEEAYGKLPQGVVLVLIQNKEKKLQKNQLKKLNLL
jgi:beta-galactosidase